MWIKDFWRGCEDVIEDAILPVAIGYVFIIIPTFTLLNTSSIIEAIAFGVVWLTLLEWYFFTTIKERAQESEKFEDWALYKVTAALACLPFVGIGFIVYKIAYPVASFLVSPEGKEFLAVIGIAIGIISVLVFFVWLNGHFAHQVHKKHYKRRREKRRGKG